MTTATPAEAVPAPHPHRPPTAAAAAVEVVRAAGWAGIRREELFDRLPDYQGIDGLATLADVDRLLAPGVAAGEVIADGSTYVAAEYDSVTKPRACPVE